MGQLATSRHARELVRNVRKPVVAYFMPKNPTTHHFITADEHLTSEYVRRAFCTLTVGRNHNNGFTLIMN